MTNVRVKICGLTRPSDVDTAVRHGAYAVGMIFAGGPRLIDAARAAALVERVPAGILRVGLFQDQPQTAVAEVLAKVPLDLLQFHGAEPNDFCSLFGLPFIKALSMRGEDPEAVAARYPDASGILLDSHEPGGRGGTGRSFEWGRRPAIRQKLWLAGGLNPDNVGRAVRTLRPWAVDVSSGVEDAPGLKNPELIRKFMESVRQENDDYQSR